MRFTRTNPTVLWALSAGALAILPACAGGTDLQPAYPDVTVTDQSADDMGLPEAEEGSDESGGDEGEDADVEPESPVRVVAGERTAIEGDAPTIRITAPRNGQTLRGNVSLLLRLANWTLAPAPGQHVHVIVDNEPYIAVRDVSGALDLSALVQENLGHELAPGTHTVRVFPSRGHHESVKSEGAFAMVQFNLTSATEGFELDADAPMLTFSRPKGCNAAGERILLDFYVSNTELAADGARVRWVLDDAMEGVITSWVPHYIEGLPTMNHTLQLQLVDAEGNVLPGPYNDTTRTFQVSSSCD